MEPVKLLLMDVFQRLALKGKTIKTDTPASEANMQALNAAIEAIEPLDLSGKLRKSTLKDLPIIVAFLAPLFPLPTLLLLCKEVRKG